MWGDFMNDSLIEKVLKVEIKGLPGPWRRGIKIDYDQIGSGRLELYGDAVLCYKTDIPWDHHWKTNDQSNRMWLMSLHYVGEMLTEIEASRSKNLLKTAKNIIISFLNEYMTDSKKIELKSSSDHAHYIRTCVLIKAIQIIKEIPEERSFFNRLVEGLIKHMKWMFDDDNHLLNNHGAMVDFGLIIGSVQLSALAESSEWRQRGFDRLTMNLKSTFDEEGMNSENTIGYHTFNISIFKFVMMFSEQNNLINIHEGEWTPIIQKANIALQHLVWQNGQIPPIGDSGVQDSSTISINKSRYFKTANFVVVKNNEIYHSIKCGFTSMVHKHADETSITLRYQGRDILVDSGSYNYDRKDPYRIYMESTGAHSGFHPSFLEGKGVFQYKEQLHSACIEYYEENDAEIYVRCRYSLKKDRIWVVRESITNFENKFIQIIDTFNSDSPNYFRQRFMFHPDVKINKNEGGLIVGSSGPVLFEMSCDGMTSIDIFNGESSLPVIRGWYSPKNNVKISTSGVDFIKEGIRGQLSTKIMLM